MRKGLEYIGQKQIDKALKEFHEASLKYPKLPTEYMIMYGIFAQAANGNPANANAARYWLEQAAQKTPSDPEPWVVLGGMALNEGRMAEAELDFAKAKELLGSYKNEQRKGFIQNQALSGMVTVAERRERWSEAQKLLEDFLKAEPNDIGALQRLARAKFWQRNPQEAYADLKKAKEIDLAKVANDKTGKTHEQMLPAAAMMAQYYDEFERTQKYTGKNPNAEKFFKYAWEHSPDDLRLRVVVAQWALENGDLALAKEQAKQALRIEAKDQELPVAKQRYPHSTAGRMLSGFVAVWEKNWPEAENYFEKVFLEAPNDFNVKNNLALTLVEQDDAAKKNRALDYAMGNYKDNKDNQQKYAEAASTLSWVCFRRGDYDTAGKAMEQALSAAGGNVSNADTATYLAYILSHNNRKYNAKQLLETFLNSGRPFTMKPEAKELYEKVKDEKPPETTPPSGTASSGKSP